MTRRRHRFWVNTKKDEGNVSKDQRENMAQNDDDKESLDRFLDQEEDPELLDALEAIAIQMSLEEAESSTLDQQDASANQRSLDNHKATDLWLERPNSGSIHSEGSAESSYTTWEKEYGSSLNACRKKEPKRHPDNDNPPHILNKQETLTDSGLLLGISAIWIEARRSNVPLNVHGVAHVGQEDSPTAASTNAQSALTDGPFIIPVTIKSRVDRSSRSLVRWGRKKQTGRSAFSNTTKVDVLLAVAKWNDSKDKSKGFHIKYFFISCEQIERMFVHQEVRKIIEGSGWLQGSPNIEVWDDFVNTDWVQVAYAESQNTGILTILSAWAFMLGMELQHSRPSTFDDERKIEAAEEILRLGLEGKLQYMTFLSFMHCFELCEDMDFGHWKKEMESLSILERSEWPYNVHTHVTNSELLRRALLDKKNCGQMEKSAAKKFYDADECVQDLGPPSDQDEEEEMIGDENEGDESIQPPDEQGDKHITTDTTLSEQHINPRTIHAKVKSNNSLDQSKDTPNSSKERDRMISEKDNEDIAIIGHDYLVMYDQHARNQGVNEQEVRIQGWEGDDTTLDLVQPAPGATQGVADASKSPQASANVDTHHMKSMPDDTAEPAELEGSAIEASTSVGDGSARPIRRMLR